ncbi:MAG: UDP-2,3-diacylglucosamine diphosphatase [Paludibacteraceae bacterium]|nr:UDP-2,3-diacylglucosamine diphosphatase [Paludibacteraceae bacterium]
MSNKKVYFLSDVHLGSCAFNDDREREQKLVRWLTSIQDNASDIYLLGDIFDFWYEYKYVIPKGFVRLLGKLAELSDKGVKLHFFIGNHDIWVRDYFEKELGMNVFLYDTVQEINGKRFYLAHGHRTGYRPWIVKLMHYVFHAGWVRRLYNCIHPTINYWFGLKWSKNNRLYKHKQEEAEYLGEDKEFLVQFAKEYSKTHPEIDYFVFGHRHVMLDLMLSKTARVVYLGDWISHFSYAVLDNEGLRLEMYEE